MNTETTNNYSNLKLTTRDAAPSAEDHTLAHTLCASCAETIAIRKSSFVNSSAINTCPNATVKPGNAEYHQVTPSISSRNNFPRYHLLTGYRRSAICNSAFLTPHSKAPAGTKSNLIEPYGTPEIISSDLLATAKHHFNAHAAHPLCNLSASMSAD